MNRVKTIAELNNIRLKQTLEAVKADIRNVVGDDFQLIIFGSHARGSAGQDSDVDLMIVLPDAANTLQIEQQVRDIVYDYAYKTDFPFSALIVGEKLARQMSGFMVFASVEREGITV